MGGAEMGFIARNDASLVIVPDWPEFCEEAFLEERHEGLFAGEMTP